MSDESMDAVLSTDANIDADLTWDNVEEVAPSLNEVNENGEVKDEWDLLGEEDTGVEENIAASDVDVEAVEEGGEEVEEPTEEVEQKASEDDVSEDESEGTEKKLSLDELDDDATIMAKVDGELQEISIKEFKNGISGEKAIAKRFSEYDVKEKEFNRQMNEVNEYINDLGTTMKSSSVLEGVSKIGELTGMPAYQIKEALIKELLPEIEARYTMDETELALKYKEQENEYLKNKTESDNATYKAEQAQRELESQVTSIREAHNINDEEWNTSFSKLDETLPKDQIITPELVADHVNFSRAETRAESLMKSFDESYLSNSEIMDAFVDSVLDNPDLSDEDFADILSNSLEQTRKEEAQAAVDKKVEAKGKSAPKVKAKVVEEEDFDDWDDIM